jgi:hypothetical protein
LAVSTGEVYALDDGELYAARISGHVQTDIYDPSGSGTVRLKGLTDLTDATFDSAVLFDADTTSLTLVADSGLEASIGLAGGFTHFVDSPIHVTNRDLVLAGSISDAVNMSGASTLLVTQDFRSKESALKIPSLVLNGTSAIAIDPNSALEMPGNSVIDVESGAASITGLDGTIQLGIGTDIVVRNGAALELDGHVRMLSSGPNKSQIIVEAGGTLFLAGTVTPALGSTVIENAGQLYVGDEGAVSALIAEVNGGPTIGFLAADGSTTSFDLHDDGNDTILLTGALDLQSDDSFVTNTLELSLESGFTPANEQEFVLIEASSITGIFEEVDLVGVSNLAVTFEAAIAVDYRADSIVARVTLIGDTDFDNDLDLADRNQILNNFNLTPARWYDGDFNGDGVVNLVDMNAFDANWGASWPSSPSIPEPATTISCLIALTTFVLRGRWL